MNFKNWLRVVTPNFVHSYGLNYLFKLQKSLYCGPPKFSRFGFTKKDIGFSFNRKLLPFTAAVFVKLTQFICIFDYAGSIELHGMINTCDRKCMLLISCPLAIFGCILFLNFRGDTVFHTIFQEKYGGGLGVLDLGVCKRFCKRNVWLRHLFASQIWSYQYNICSHQNRMKKLDPLCQRSAKLWMQLKWPCLKICRLPTVTKKVLCIGTWLFSNSHSCPVDVSSIHIIRIESKSRPRK